jgi:hypothetical protein
MKKPFHSFILLISSILLFSQFLPVSGNEEPELSTTEDKLNLALRQVGHQLLIIEGNNTIQVPPVTKDEKGKHRLKLESSFNYDTLPYLLDQALEQFELENKYQVTIRDCEEEKVILGYNFHSFQVKQIACIGREQHESCNIIEVTLLNESETRGGIPYHYFLGLLGLIGLVWYVKSVFFSKKDSSLYPVAENPKKETIALGSLIYDYRNQLIKSPDEEKTLTFRENKLLFLLTSHPNEVLERDKILDEVWGDEGVIVGRSLDVFISRLRKILKLDPALQIKSVHGVGYKLVI